MVMSLILKRIINWIDCQAMRIKIIKEGLDRDVRAHPILLRSRKESVDGQYIVLSSQLHSIQNYFNLLRHLNHKNSQRSTQGFKESNQRSKKDSKHKVNLKQKATNKQEKSNTLIPQSLSCSRLNSLSLTNKTPLKTRTNWVGTILRRKNHGSRGNLIKGTTTREQIISSNQNRHLSVQHENIDLAKNQSEELFIPVGNTSSNNLQSYLSMSNIHTGLEKNSGSKTPIRTSCNASRQNRYSSKIMKMQTKKRKEKCKTEIKKSPKAQQSADEGLGDFKSIKKMIETHFKKRSRASTPSAWENIHLF